MNARVYWTLKNMAEAEKVPYLVKMGLTEEQATDLIEDLRINMPKIQKRDKSKFTTSQAWLDIENRMGELMRKVKDGNSFQRDGRDREPPHQDGHRPPIQDRGRDGLEAVPKVPTDV